ncbi:MAG: undecaprenyl-diphosphate phosphatase [bacterium]|nr:undecaprenyl-diphosphate phosphatase [bacterium]
MEFQYHYLLLGLVQGLTEFLPVSSSGHLVLFERLLIEGMSSSSQLTVNVAFHMGTLIAVMAYFKQEILEYCKATVKFICSPKSPFNQVQWEVLMVLLLSLPTGILGLAMKKGGIESIPTWGVLLALCVTAFICFGIDRINNRNFSAKKIMPHHAIILGLVQGIAVVPGISRSGSTIFAGLLCGFSREKMASFSFLMSIPAITGAFLLECKELLEMGAQDVHLISLGLGTFVAMLSGYCSLALLVRLLKGKKFKIFGFYCLAVAVIGFLGT